MSMQRLAQKKPVSNSSSPPVQKGVSWQRPFSDPVYDAVSPKQEETAPPEITPRAGFNLTQMKIFPDSPAAGVQAKLTVGAPGDKYEQEADAMAGKVMAMPAPENEEPIQRQTAPEEKKEEEVQTKKQESSSIQREMAPEEKEEEVQTKKQESSSIQREMAPEEKEEEVQTKPLESSSIQRETAPEEKEEEVQTKPLAVGELGDKYEQEADEAAGQEMDMAASVSKQPIQRQPDPDEEQNAANLPQTALAGGIFQELKYPIPQNLPGPQPGTTARYNLSFRDKSGFPNPTSHAYLNRTSPPPGTRWKGLRLDHGPNVKTGGTTNWHWNQSGAGNTFGIADHTVASPAAANFGRMMKYAKPLGRAALVAGAAMDTYSLGSEINQSRQTGNWNNTIVEGSRIAGGWGGAALGAKAGGTAGAAIGTLIAPGIGTAIGGAIGGLAGGALGYWGGSAGGSALSEWLLGNKDKK